MMEFVQTTEHRNFLNVARIYWDDLPYPTHEGLDLCIGYAKNHGDITNHCHDDFFELVLVTEGTAFNFLEGNTFPIRKGSVFVIHPNQKHGYTEAGSLNLFNICISESALKQLPVRLLSSPGYVALFRVEPTIRERKGVPPQLILSSESLEDVAAIADRLRGILADPEPLNGIRARAILTELLTLITLEYQALVHTPARQVSLEFARVLSYMQTHCGEPITVAEVSRQMGMSSRTLHRSCLNYTGFSPKQLLMELRLEMAKQRLCNSSDSITEVAFRCGFTDSNHFSRQFRTKVGLSPREYRQRGAGTDSE